MIRKIITVKQMLRRATAHQLYCFAIEVVCGGSPIGCGLVERKAQDRVKWEG